MALQVKMDDKFLAFVRGGSGGNGGSGGSMKIFLTEDSGTYSASESFADILSAIESGQYVYAVDESRGQVFHLNQIDSNNIPPEYVSFLYFNIFDEGDPTVRAIQVVISNDESVQLFPTEGTLNASSIED